MPRLRRPAVTQVICVVEEPKDVQAVERTREFKGRYQFWAARWIRCPGRR